MRTLETSTSGVALPEALVHGLLLDGRILAADDDGNVVRLRGEALPGERVVWQASATRKGGSSGDITDIVVASPKRRPPSCSWHARCGGCDLAAWEPEARAASLQASVAKLLDRETLPTWHSSPAGHGYRTRISLGIESGRLGYREARSHTLVEIGRCDVADALCNEGIATLRGWLDQHPEFHPFLTGVELRSSGTSLVYSLRGKGSRPTELAHSVQALGNVAVNGKTVAGDTTLVMGDGLPIYASAEAFYQVNRSVNHALVRHVLEELEPCTTLLELYAGNGNFSIPLAQAGKHVTAVELEGASLRDLRRAAKEHALDIQVIGKNVGRLDPMYHPCDGVLLDPPRGGAPGVLQKLARQRPVRIVYVSCNPLTLARDLRALPGYRIRDVHCFDMFPNTHHVETVVTLERSNPNDKVLGAR